MNQHNFPTGVFYLSVVLQLHCTVVNSHAIISSRLLLATSGVHSSIERSPIVKVVDLEEFVHQSNFTQYTILQNTNSFLVNQIR